MSQWERASDVARRLKVSPQAVHKQIVAGRLTAWQVTPHHVVVLTEDVERWAQERRGRVRFDCPAVLA